MHSNPSYGKGLCRLYIEANRHADAVQVASSCYSHVRNQILDHTPVGEAFETALNTWMHWTEICGNIYTECDQKYMARHMYELTIEDLKRFYWDSPMTKMQSRSHEFYSKIFKEKLERLGPDSDDEADSDEEPEAYVPIERRLKLAYLKSATLLTARIECTTMVVDIDKAPPYKALSYAWDNTRKVISYTRDDGPPYADNGDEDDCTFPKEVITVDGQDVLIGTSLFRALQQIRQPDSVLAIWVDALCTTPVELKKRAEWALAMKDIYKSAAEVVIWLGQGDEHTQKGIEFMDKFWDERPKRYSDLGEYLFGAQASVPWQEIEALFRLPWWSRIWTIQEFLVAKDLSIRCGSKTISWRNLLEFSTFVDLAPLPKRLAEDRKAILQPHIAFVREKHRYLELRDEYRMRAGISLETLWQATKSHESYDPRDKIYALLGVLDEPSAKYAPKIDYGFCPCAVYSDMLCFRGIRQVLNDDAMASAQRTGMVMLQGLEQGSEAGLEHYYLWDSQRLDGKCDGEECGRRLKCFSDQIPAYPDDWSLEKAWNHTQEIFKLYTDLRKTQMTVEALGEQILAKATVTDESVDSSHYPREDPH